MDKYDVQYFIDKFEAIPAEKWIVANLSNEEGCHCALGWCGVVENEDRDWVPTEEALALINIFQPVGLDRDKPQYLAVYQINDDYTNVNYLGSNPRERILNQLYAAKSPEVKDND